MRTIRIMKEVKNKRKRKHIDKPQEENKSKHNSSCVPCKVPDSETPTQQLSNQKLNLIMKQQQHSRRRKKSSGLSGGKKTLYANFKNTFNGKWRSNDDH